MALPSGVKVDILINGQVAEERECFICDTQRPTLMKYTDVPNGAHFSIRVSVDTKMLDSSGTGTSLVVQLESGTVNSVPLTRLFSREDIERFALGPSHVFYGQVTQGENEMDILHPFAFECKEENYIEIYFRKVRNENFSKATGRDDIECGDEADQEGQLVAVEVPPDGPGVCGRSDVYGDPWLNYTFKYDVYDPVTKKQLFYTPPFADDIESRDIDHLSLREAKEVVRRLKARCETLTKEEGHVSTNSEHPKAGTPAMTSPPETVKHGSENVGQESAAAVSGHCSKPPYIFGGVSAAPPFSPVMDRTPALKLFPDAVFDEASIKHHSHRRGFAFEISTPSKKSTRATPVRQWNVGDEQGDPKGINAVHSLDSSNVNDTKHSVDPADYYPISTEPPKKGKGHYTKSMREKWRTMEFHVEHGKADDPLNWVFPVPPPKPEVGGAGPSTSQPQSTTTTPVPAFLTTPINNAAPTTAPTTSKSSSTTKRRGKENTATKAAAKPAENSGDFKTSRMRAESPWSQRKAQKKEDSSKPEMDLTELYGNLSLGPRHLNPVYDDAIPDSSSKPAVATETTKDVEEGDWEASPVF